MLINSLEPVVPLGLANNVAALTTYDSEWEVFFEDEKKVLAGALADLPATIEHIGSTAVPGLRAKPILDIGIGVKDAMLIQPITMRLIDHGYIHLGFRSEQMGHVFEKMLGSQRTHCAHLLEETSPHWHDYLALRDRLRTDAVLRQAYERLKLSLVEQFGDNRQAYTAGKARFIREKLLIR